MQSSSELVVFGTITLEKKSHQKFYKTHDTPKNGNFPVVQQNPVDELEASTSPHHLTAYRKVSVVYASKGRSRKVAQQNLGFA